MPLTLLDKLLKDIDKQGLSSTTPVFPPGLSMCLVFPFWVLISSGQVSWLCCIEMLGDPEVDLLLHAFELVLFVNGGPLSAVAQLWPGWVSGVCPRTTTCSARLSTLALVLARPGVISPTTSLHIVNLVHLCQDPMLHCQSCEAEVAADFLAFPPLFMVIEEAVFLGLWAILESDSRTFENEVLCSTTKNWVTTRMMWGGEHTISTTVCQARKGCVMISRAEQVPTREAAAIDSPWKMRSRLV